MTYSLVIRDGRVIDGSGAPAEPMDVAVEDGRIVKLGRIRDNAARVIDASGLVVTPGFIDGHTHMDAQVMWDELGSCSCYHGVTTAVMGNCGFTLAPARADRRDLVVRSLERAEDMSREVLNAGIDWTWETFPEYLDAVERRPKGINYACNVGHSALRTWVMGDRAFEHPAMKDELAAMAQLLREALQAGAVGFTTSRNSGHLTSDDRAVASRLADWEEVRSLVAVLGDLGAGVFELAREDSPDPDEQEDYVRRLVQLATESGVAITGGALNTSALNFVDRISDAGGRAFAQTHSRGVTSILSFRTHLPFDVLAAWKQIRSLPLEEQRRHLSDPEVRARLIEEAHRGPYPTAHGAEARPPDYQAMHVYDRVLPPHQSIADAARERGVDPVELIIQLGLDSDFDQLFIQAISVAPDDELLSTLKHPHGVMTFSDSGAHVSQISDCSIQTYLLSYWVRQRREFTLEEAVRMLTSTPAQAWGFADRGLIREGMVADLNVFDPDRVEPELPIVSHDLPGSGIRLVQKARGFLATIVAGEVLIDNGEPTDARSGKLIRGPLARAYPSTRSNAT